MYDSRSTYAKASYISVTAQGSLKRQNVARCLALASWGSLSLGSVTWEFPTVYIALAKYLCAHILVWGIILICHASANSFGAFFVLRFILVFGGFVSYGISFYDGPTLRGYQIMYYLLGGLAILVGLVVLLWFPDSPITWRILTEEQRIVCLERVRDDQGGIAKKKFKKDQVIEASLDVRMWLIVLAMLNEANTDTGNARWGCRSVFCGALWMVLRWKNKPLLRWFQRDKSEGSLTLWRAYLLRHINIRLNRKKLGVLAEFRAVNGRTDEMLQQEAERHAFADLTAQQ
ncbi:hypothetical protein V8E55_001784 [Tylopilus felleus]